MCSTVNHLLMDTSRSFKQSTMVLRCLCTALWSVCTVFSRDVNATYLKLIKEMSTGFNQTLDKSMASRWNTPFIYLIFLSLLRRKRPNMLMAKTCKKETSIQMSYNLQKDSHNLCLKWTHPQSTFRLDVHYSQYSLVQDCISYIFTRLRVCSNLQVYRPWICQNNT